MALITCPDCGKQVSSRATACPNCGCPIDEKAVEPATPVYADELNYQRYGNKDIGASLDRDGIIFKAAEKSDALKENDKIRRHIPSWIISILLLLSGTGSFLTSILTAICYILGGVIINPIVRKTLKLKTSIAVVLTIVLFVAGGLLSPTGGSSAGNASSEQSSANTQAAEQSESGGLEESTNKDTRWASSFTPINDFRYTLDKEALTISLVRYEGSDTKILLSPTYTIDGTNYNLVSMGDDACFLSETYITSVYIPEGVTYMGDSCFNSCTSLQYLYIPSTIQSISNNFLGYFHDYALHYESTADLPGDRDTNDYEELVDDTSSAEDLGESMGRAANGILSGLNDEDDITTEIYFGGTEAQWESISD